MIELAISLALTMAMPPQDAKGVSLRMSTIRLRDCSDREAVVSMAGDGFSVTTQQGVTPTRRLATTLQYRDWAGGCSTTSFQDFRANGRSGLRMIGSIDGRKYGVIYDSPGRFAVWRED